MAVFGVGLGPRDRKPSTAAIRRHAVSRRLHRTSVLAVQGCSTAGGLFTGSGTGGPAGFCTMHITASVSLAPASVARPGRAQENGRRICVAAVGPSDSRNGTRRQRSLMGNMIINERRVPHASQLAVPLVL